MTLRLLTTAWEQWVDLDGWAVAHGMKDLRSISLFRFVSFVQWWLTKDAPDAAARASFEAKLWQPPPGVEPAPGSPWSPEAELGALNALHMQLGGAGSGGSADNGSGGG